MVLWKVLMWRVPKLVHEKGRKMEWRKELVLGQVWGRERAEVLLVSALIH
jgi:hypothetical protein